MHGVCFAPVTCVAGKAGMASDSTPSYNCESYTLVSSFCFMIQLGHLKILTLQIVLRL